MLDIRLIRKNPEKVKEGIKKKGFDEKLVDEVLKVDKERRGKIKEVEELRVKINRISKEIGKEKNEEKKKKLLKESKEVSKKLEKLEDELRDKEKNSRI